MIPVQGPYRQEATRSFGKAHMFAFNGLSALQAIGSTSIARRLKGVTMYRICIMLLVAMVAPYAQAASCNGASNCTPFVGGADGEFRLQLDTNSEYGMPDPPSGEMNLFFFGNKLYSRDTDGLEQRLGPPAIWTTTDQSASVTYIWADQTDSFDGLEVGVGAIAMSTWSAGTEPTRVSEFTTENLPVGLDQSLTYYAYSFARGTSSASKGIRSDGNVTFGHASYMWSVWFYIDGAQTTSNYLVAAGNGSTNDSISITSTGSIVLKENTVNISSDNGLVLVDRLTHLEVHATTNSHKFYINGAEVYSDTDAMSPWTTSLFVMGKNATAGNDYHGQIFQAIYHGSTSSVEEAGARFACGYDGEADPSRRSYVYGGVNEPIDAGGSFECGD